MVALDFGDGMAIIVASILLFGDVGHCVVDAITPFHKQLAHDRAAWTIHGFLKCRCESNIHSYGIIKSYLAQFRANGLDIHTELDQLTVALKQVFLLVLFGLLDDSGSRIVLNL